MPAPLIVRVARTGAERQQARSHGRGGLGDRALQKDQNVSPMVLVKRQVGHAAPQLQRIGETVANRLGCELDIAVSACDELRQ